MQTFPYRYAFVARTVFDAAPRGRETGHQGDAVFWCLCAKAAEAVKKRRAIAEGRFMSVFLFWLAQTFLRMPEREEKTVSRTRGHTAEAFALPIECNVVLFAYMQGEVWLFGPSLIIIE